MQLGSNKGKKAESALERRVWLVALVASIVLGAADILHRHVARSSALSAICMVFVIVAAIVGVVAIFTWARLRERRRSAPGSV